MIPLILPLDDPRADLATAGGKGASLARLSRAGLPVPAGFHLTTRAYRERSMKDVLEAFRELGEQIEALHGTPMDVEWALADGKFWILQARPITSLRVEWNDSLDGDYLWSSGNVGEAIPEVMTPVTWSLVRVLSSMAIGPHRISGNIGGRFYLNISTYTALGTAIGRADEMRRAGEETFGRIPAGVTVPPLPMSRLAILGAVLRGAGGPVKQQILYRTRLPQLVRDNPGRCAAAHKAIAGCSSAGSLLDLWRRDLDQLLRFVCPVLDAGARMIAGGPAAFRRKLADLAGEEDAATLLTGFHDGAGLASLGPLVGLARLRSGEIDRDTFDRTWGHRSANEFEISAPRLAEDPEWISRQLETPADPEALLARQALLRAEAWDRLVAQHPAAAPKIRKQLDRIGAGARAREQARSEMVRAFWVMRAFVLRAGELTSSGDDLFFLPIDGVLRVLGGETSLLNRVHAQRTAYDRYRALPPYPAVIRGRFHPESWAASANRRADLYDATTDVPMPSDVTGFPGSAGVVEGVARVLVRVEDGESLQQGEVLVTTVTNIGWTPLLFTRAAAVVTDVGAPLSHAAIVARELGIPAVVGCGNATTRIASGDRIQVDGAKGTVKKVR